MILEAPDPSHENEVGEREIVIDRWVDAPRAVVFEAFTELRHLSQWWGPDGFTTVTRSFEFRAGGEWIFTMRGPDGTIYPEWITWTIIDPPNRIGMLHGEHPGGPHLFEATVTFQAVGDATRIEMRTLFPSKKHRDDAVERFGALEGGHQTLAKLADYLGDRATDESENR